MLTQFGILGSHTHRASVEIALTHHHTTQHDQHGSSESELIGTQQSHQHNVASCLYLAIHLEPHLPTKSVAYQCLLGLAQTYLGRNARKSHTRRRRSTSTAFCTRDDDEIGLCLGHTSRNRPHSTLSHEFHADGCLRIDVLKVENQLCQVFNRVDIVMRRWRNQRDTRYGMPCLGNHLIYLEAWQLSAFTRLGSLCHLDLYLFCVHKIFCGHTETTTGHLLGLAR